MQNLYEALGRADMDDMQRGELGGHAGQLYLSALPDLSWAKHGIHRKGTPGFSQDARRAFAQNTFHGARYLAKVRYSDLLENQLIDARSKSMRWLTPIHTTRSRRSRSSTRWSSATMPR